MKKSLILTTIFVGATSLVLSADALATSTVDANKSNHSHQLSHHTRSTHPIKQMVHGTENVVSGVGHAAVGLVGGVIQGTGMLVTGVVKGTGKMVTGVMHGTGHAVKGAHTTLTKPLHTANHHKMHHHKMHHHKMHHQKVKHHMKHKAEMMGKQKTKTLDDMKNKTDMTTMPTKS